MLYRLVLAAELRELVRKHEADVVLPGTEVSEFLQRPESLVEVPRLLHSVGVLEEVLLGVGREALVCADLSKGVVDRRSPGRMAENFVAEGDRVVVETAVHVANDRALVVIDGVRDVALPKHQIADPIEERNV